MRSRKQFEKEKITQVEALEVCDLNFEVLMRSLKEFMMMKR